MKYVHIMVYAMKYSRFKYLHRIRSILVNSGRQISQRRRTRNKTLFSWKIDHIASLFSFFQVPTGGGAPESIPRSILNPSQ